MQDFMELDSHEDARYLGEREHHLEISVKELEKVNKQLAKLLVRKDELTATIIGALEHEHEGQKSYEYGVWKIEVKTPYIYSLDKKQYELTQLRLPDEFNPVKQSVAYTVDKRLCDKYMTEAPKKVRDMLIEIISKKPGKAGITIKERV